MLLLIALIIEYIIMINLIEDINIDIFHINSIKKLRKV